MRYLLGLIGHPVRHSLSPPMHKAALRHYGLDGDYRLIDLDAAQLPEGLSRLRAERYFGFNVTVPHKLSVMKLASRLTGEAEQLRAVNTVLVERQGLTGHNTDLGGFMGALSGAGAASPGTVCVIGAGGAARAAVWGLLKLGWRQIFVVSRSRQTAQSLIEEVKTNAASQSGMLVEPDLHSLDKDLEGLQPAPDLLVNASPLGLHDDELPDWVLKLIACVDAGGFVFDMVYRASGDTTPILRQSLMRGLSGCDGVPMLVNQAALAFEFWTGRPGPAEIMRSALEKARAALK